MQTQRKCAEIATSHASASDKRFQDSVLYFWLTDFRNSAMVVLRCYECEGLRVLPPLA